MHRWARWVAALLGGAVGLWVATHVVEATRQILAIAVSRSEQLGALALGVLVLGLVGFLAGPALAEGAAATTRWLEGHLVRLPGADILFGVAGAIIGLIVALLLGPALSRIPTAGDYLPAVVSVFFALIGWRVFVRKGDDLQRLIGLRRVRADAGPGERQRARMLRRRAAMAADGATAAGGGAGVPPTGLGLGGGAAPMTGAMAGAHPERGEAASASGAKVLDTSSVIDGRIADLCRTGFLEGPLLVPEFVLDELRHIADSSDPLKRNRGRRGLDVLAGIQKEHSAQVQIVEGRSAPGQEVDRLLLRLARERGAKVITTDYNLNKVAGLQGVQVLNVNELANALKPVLLPGEEITVRVVREGKEPGQGVAYLDDGTMIVIDGGRRFLGEELGVEVTSTLQTAAGRMIFARPQAAGAAAPLQRVAESR
jgi:uncharacterized protein YacL